MPKKKPKTRKPRRKPTGYTLSVSNSIVDATSYTVILHGIPGYESNPRIIRCASARSLKACLTRTQNKYGPPEELHVSISGFFSPDVIATLNEVTRIATDKSGLPKSAGTR